MKKRKFLVFLATALLCVLFTVLSVQAEETSSFSGGAGTENDPYQISSETDLKQLDYVDYDESKSMYFKLMDDISLKSWNISVPLNGCFDGNGKTISGLTQPLFGSIEKTGKLSNLTVVNVNIVDSNFTGSICGSNFGTISDCNVEGGSISGGTYVGGICGQSGSIDGGTIINCHISNCNITGNNYVGGICGSFESLGVNIANCTNSDGKVSGKSYVGGICGANTKIISNCDNSSAVQGNSNVGGICGRNASGSITDCENSGTINSEGMTAETGTSDNYIGGVCGNNAGTITGSSSKAPETKPGTTTTPSTNQESTEKEPADQNTTNQDSTTTTPEPTTPESTAPEPTTPGTTTPTTPSDSTQPGATTPTETAPSVVTPNSTPETVPTVNVPAPGKVQKIAAGNTKKQAVVLTWKKNKDAKGYQIEYALNKKFTKQKKVKNAKKTSVTIKKLKKGKTYFFRVRAFKVVNGEMVYGKWSAVKKIKIKK